MQHHIALPPDAMGKITYIAPPGQYSLKVCLLNLFTGVSPAYIFLQHYFLCPLLLFKFQGCLY